MRFLRLTAGAVLVTLALLASLPSQAQTPACGIIIRNLTDSVVANNAMHHAAHTELIRDLGGHENTAIERNPGSLKALCPPA